MLNFNHHINVDVPKIEKIEIKTRNKQFRDINKRMIDAYVYMYVYVVCGTFTSNPQLYKSRLKVDYFPYSHYDL